MSEHSDVVRLRHMLDYAREIVQFTENKTRADLDTDLVLERAIRYSIGIIGEAASHLSADLRAGYPDVPWADIVGMRNFLFHVYFRVESDILWRTATESIPALITWVEQILAESDSEDDSS